MEKSEGSHKQKLAKHLGLGSAGSARPNQQLRTSPGAGASPATMEEPPVFQFFDRGNPKLVRGIAVQEEYKAKPHPPSPKKLVTSPTKPPITKRMAGSQSTNVPSPTSLGRAYARGARPDPSSFCSSRLDEKAESRRSNHHASGRNTFLTDSLAGSRIGRGLDAATSATSLMSPLTPGLHLNPFHGDSDDQGGEGPRWEYDYSTIPQPRRRRGDVLMAESFRSMGRPTGQDDKDTRNFLSNSQEFKNCLAQAIGVGVMEAMKRLPPFVYSGDERLREYLPQEAKDSAMTTQSVALEATSNSLSLAGSKGNDSGAMASDEGEVRDHAPKDVKRYLRAPSSHPTQGTADMRGLWRGYTEPRIPQAPRHTKADAPMWAKTARIPRTEEINVTPKETYLRLEDKKKTTKNSPPASAGKKRECGSKSALEALGGDVLLLDDTVRPSTARSTPVIPDVRAPRPVLTRVSSSVCSSRTTQVQSADSHSPPPEPDTGAKHFATLYVQFLMSLEEPLSRDRIVSMSQQVLEHCTLLAIRSSRDPEKRREAAKAEGEGDAAAELAQHVGTKEDEMRLTMRMEQQHTAAFNEVLTVVRNDMRYLMTGIDETNLVVPPAPNHISVEETAMAQGMRPSYALPLRKKAVFEWQFGPGKKKKVLGLNEPQYQNTDSASILSGKGNKNNSRGGTGASPTRSQAAGSVRGGQATQQATHGVGPSFLCRKKSTVTVHTVSSEGTSGATNAGGGGGSTRFPRGLLRGLPDEYGLAEGLSMNAVAREITLLRNRRNGTDQDLEEVVIPSSNKPRSLTAEEEEFGMMTASTPRPHSPDTRPKSPARPLSPTSARMKKKLDKKVSAAAAAKVESELASLFFPYPPTKSALVQALGRAKEKIGKGELKLNIPKALRECQKTYEDVPFVNTEPQVSARDPVVAKFRRVAANTLPTEDLRWYEKGRRQPKRVNPRDLHTGSFDVYGVSPCVTAELQREQPKYLVLDVDDDRPPPTSRDLGVLENKALDTQCRQRSQLINWMY